MNTGKASELKVIFFYVAVNFYRCSPQQKQELLHFDGGQHNDKIGVWCAMGAQGLEPLLQKLEEMGEHGELFFVGVEDGMRFMLPEPQPEPMLLAPWLQGRWQDDGLWLSYVDES